MFQNESALTDELKWTCKYQVIEIPPRTLDGSWRIYSNKWDSAGIYRRRWERLIGEDKKTKRKTKKKGREGKGFGWLVAWKKTKLQWKIIWLFKKIIKINLFFYEYALCCVVPHSFSCLPFFLPRLQVGDVRMGNPSLFSAFGN